MIPVLFPVCAKRTVPRTYSHITPFHLFPMSFPCSPVLHFPMSPFTRLPLSPFPHFPIPPQTVWHQIGRSMWCHRPCGTTLGTPAPCGATSPMGSPDGPYVVPHGRRNAQTPHLRIKNRKVTNNIENTCYLLGL